MSENNEKKKSGKGGLIKLIIVVVIIAAVFAIAHFTGLTQYLSLDDENIQAMRGFFEGFGFWGYLVFIALYIPVAVFMLPAFFFTIFAGAVYGWWLGGLLSLIGATIGATASFVIARYVARDSIVNRFGSSPFFNKIDNGLKENGVSFLILTRLVPAFPYNVQNYIYGLTPINLPKYVVVTFITMAPGAAIYAFMADQIIREGVSLRLMLSFAGAGVALFLISLIPKYIAKKKGIKLQDDAH